MAAPAPRTSQVAVQQASNSGFLSSIGVLVDGTEALSERLGTSGLKGACAVASLARPGDVLIVRHSGGGLQRGAHNK